MPHIISYLKLNNYQRLTKIHTYVSYFVVAMWVILNFDNITYFNLELSCQSFFYKLTWILSVVNLIRFLYFKNFKLFSVGLIFLVIAIVVYNKVGSKEMLKYVLISLSISNLNLKKVQGIFLFIIGIFTITVILMNLFEFSDNFYVNFRDGNSIRYSFGFGHPNAIGAILFFFVLTLWSYYSNIISHFFSIAFFVLVYVFLSKFVDCRTAQLLIYVAIFFICLCALCDYLNLLKYKKFKSLICLLCILSIFFIAISFILLSCMYDENNLYLVQINKLLSHRVGLSHNAIVCYGFSIFGKILSVTDLDPTGLGALSTTAYQYIDSFYVYTALNYGISSLLIYITSFVIIVKKAFDSNNYRIAIAIMIFAIYGITEQVFSSITYNILIYIAFANFLDNKSQKTNLTGAVAR